MKPFEGKVAIVTGAANGIGKAVAWKLGVMGAKIVANDIGCSDECPRDISVIEKAVKEMRMEGIDCTASYLDIGDSKTQWRLPESAYSTYGRVDYFINCAAYRYLAEWNETYGFQTRRQFDVNVLGSIFLTQTCADYMMAHGDGGHIFLFGSGAIDMAPSASAIYAATKAAVDTYSRCLAPYLATKNIILDCIWPAAQTRLNPNATAKPHDVANFISERLRGMWAHAPEGAVWSVNGKDVCLVIDRMYAPYEE